MRAAKKRKGRVFDVHVCRYCGRKTRGPAHFRHEQACGRDGRGRRMGARGRTRRTVPGRGRGGRGGGPVGQFVGQLRRLVQREIQRQLGLAL